MMKMDIKKICALLYAVFVVSALMQCWYLTTLPGLIVLLVATGVAYEKRKEAHGTLFESHLTWLIRTFWIGGGVYLPILTAIATFALMSQIDFGALMQRMAAGDIADPRQLQDILLKQQGSATIYTIFAFTLPFLAWWMWRCWTGYTALKNDSSVKNVMSWL